MFLRFRSPKPTSELVAGKVAMVEGTVVVQKPLTVPHTAHAAAWYEILEEAYKSSERGGRQMWLVEKRERKSPGFFVEDTAGRVFITGNLNDFDVSGALRVEGISDKKGLRRYVAHYLKPGMTVRVRGAVTAAAAGEPPGVLVLRPDAMTTLEILVR